MLSLLYSLYMQGTHMFEVPNFKGKVSLNRIFDENVLVFFSTSNEEYLLTIGMQSPHLLAYLGKSWRTSQNQLIIFMYKCYIIYECIKNKTLQKDKFKSYLWQTQTECFSSNACRVFMLPLPGSAQCNGSNIIIISKE